MNAKKEIIKYFFITVSFILFFGILPNVQAEPQTVTLTSPNYKTSNLALQFPDRANPNLSSLSVWNFYNYTSKALIWFDLSSAGLPQDAEIQSATLSLNISNVINGGNFSVYSAINDNWQVNVTNATWNNFDGVNPWRAGRGVHTGSYATPALSTVAITSVDANTYKDWDVTTAVQGWVNATSSNYGLWLIAENPVPTRMSFNGRNARLIITYTGTAPPPPPPGNHAPVLNSIPSQTIEENQTLSFTISATDEDQDILTFTTSALPTGASLMRYNKTDRNRDGYTDSSDIAFFTAHKGTRLGERNYDILADFNEDDVIDDVDQGALVIMLGALRTNPNFNRAQFNWRPTIGQANTYNITFTVADSSGASASRTVPITVTPAPAVPAVSNVKVTNIREDSATISWATLVPATTQIDYGITAEYGSSTPLDDTLTTEHSQTITGLNIFTMYHFRVKSVDQDGNEIFDTDRTFTTISQVTLFDHIKVGTTNYQFSTPSSEIEFWASHSDNLISPRFQALQELKARQLAHNSLAPATQYDNYYCLYVLGVYRERRTSLSQYRGANDAERYFNFLLDKDNRWLDYAERHGYNPEEAYIHYRNQTRACFGSNCCDLPAGSRVPTYWLPPNCNTSAPGARVVLNPGNEHYRAFNAEFIYNITHTPVETNPNFPAVTLDGIMIDNSGPGITALASRIEPNADGTIGGIIDEYPDYNSRNVDSYTNDIARAFEEVRRANPDKLQIPNVATYAMSARYLVPFLSSSDGAMLEFIFNYETNNTSGLQSLFDNIRNNYYAKNKIAIFMGTNKPDEERSHRFTLSAYYLIKNELAYFNYIKSSSQPAEPNEWFAAMEYDIGQPRGDYYTFNDQYTYTTPSGTVRVVVWARDFDNALVLLKPRPAWNINFSDTHTYPLPVTSDNPTGLYHLLYSEIDPDNPGRGYSIWRLGPAVSEITLINGDGAILVKESAVE